MVFVVSIDSPRRNQVKIGNSIKPADEPMNLAVHTDPVASTIIFHAYQKEIDVGTPMTKAAVMGLFCHHSDKYCVFSWNHPRV